MGRLTEAMAFINDRSVPKKKERTPFQSLTARSAYFRCHYPHLDPDNDNLDEIRRRNLQEHNVQSTTDGPCAETPATKGKKPDTSNKKKDPER